MTVGDFLPAKRLDDSRLCRVVNELGDRFLLSCDVQAKPIIRVCRVRGRS